LTILPLLFRIGTQTIAAHHGDLVSEGNQSWHRLFTRLPALCTARGMKPDGTEGLHTIRSLSPIQRNLRRDACWIMWAHQGSNLGSRYPRSSRRSRPIALPHRGSTNYRDMIIGFDKHIGRRRPSGRTRSAEALVRAGIFSRSCRACRVLCWSHLHGKNLGDYGRIDSAVSTT